MEIEAEEKLSAEENTFSGERGSGSLIIMGARNSGRQVRMGLKKKCRVSLSIENVSFQDKEEEEGKTKNKKSDRFLRKRNKQNKENNK